MPILCEDCKNFKPAYDAQMMMAVYGYCRELEYPFLQAIFKPEARERFPEAFGHPEECEYFVKGKGKAT